MPTNTNLPDQADIESAISLTRERIAVLTAKVSAAGKPPLPAPAPTEDDDLLETLACLERHESILRGQLSSTISPPRPAASGAGCASPAAGQPAGAAPRQPPTLTARCLAAKAKAEPGKPVAQDGRDLTLTERCLAAKGGVL